MPYFESEDQRKKLTDNDIRRIRTMRKNGQMTHKQIAISFGVAKEYVQQILKGKCRADVLDADELKEERD